MSETKQVLPIYKGKDYTGERIGEWLVLGEATYTPTKNGGRYKWKCKCSSCGREKWNPTNTILYGRSMMCVSCRNQEKNSSKNNNGNWKGHGEIPGEVLHRIREGAKRRGRTIPVSITCEDLDRVWKDQGGRCAYTNRQITLLKDASVDRIDSSKGYEVGNIEWVHKDVNKAKMALSREDFLSMVDEIHRCRIAK
jgi:hypothetical protein